MICQHISSVLAIWFAFWCVSSGWAKKDRSRLVQYRKRFDMLIQTGKSNLCFFKSTLSCHFQSKTIIWRDRFMLQICRQQFSFSLILTVPLSSQIQICFFLSETSFGKKVMTQFKFNLSQWVSRRLVWKEEFHNFCSSRLAQQRNFQSEIMIWWENGWTTKITETIFHSIREGKKIESSFLKSLN